MTTQFEKINENFSGDIDKKLPTELVVNCKQQLESGAAFCESILKEAKAIESWAVKLKKKIKDHTEQGLNKCFLKSNLEKYENCCPTFDIPALETLIQMDIDACKHMNTDSREANIKKVVVNYNDFMKKQQEELKAFVIKQQKLMYGFQFTPILTCTKLCTRLKRI